MVKGISRHISNSGPKRYGTGIKAKSSGKSKIFKGRKYKKITKNLKRAVQTAAERVEILYKSRVKDFVVNLPGVRNLSKRRSEWKMKGNSELHSYSSYILGEYAPPVAQFRSVSHD